MFKNKHGLTMEDNALLSVQRLANDCEFVTTLDYMQRVLYSSHKKMQLHTIKAITLIEVDIYIGSSTNISRALQASGP